MSPMEEILSDFKRSSIPMTVDFEAHDDQSYEPGRIIRDKVVERWSSVYGGTGACSKKRR